MEQERITLRQLLIILFAALLSPAVRLLPVRTAQEAGRAGWLSALAALPVVLLLCRTMTALLQKARDGEGLSELLQRTLGTLAGRIITGVYLIWGLILLSACARLFGLRFLSTGYRNSPMWFFLAAALLLVLWLSGKPLPVFARTAQIFCPALVFCLCLCLVFGLFQVRPLHFLPVWLEDLPSVALATRPVLAVAGCGVFSGFLGGSLHREPGGSRAMHWGMAFCLLLTALQLVCIGRFGPGLVRKMETPFFVMVKGIGVPGAFERAESVVVALWVLSDLVLLTYLTESCCAMAQSLMGFRRRSRAALPVAAAALAGARALFPDAFVLGNWLSADAEWISLALGVALPVLLCPVVTLRNRKNSTHLVV